MKEKFIENGIEYVRNGDYYIPNLTVPDDKIYNIGKYGRMHERFIKENRPCFCSMKMLNGTWLAYLEEIDTSAKEMVDRLIKELVVKRGATEELKAIITPVIEDYKSGKITYAEAEFDARVKIYQSVNPNFNPDVEYIKDPIYRDIPSVDNSLFILARKVLIDSKI